MKILKTMQEYQLMKDEMSIEIDKFLNKFNEFTNSTSPANWRSTGSLYTKIKKFKTDLRHFEPLRDGHLEHDWIRKEVLTQKEQEEYDNIKKYNL